MIIYMWNSISGSKTVLFVDDEASVLSSIERLFIDSNMKILRAANGDEALDFIKKEDIAVVVSDNLMPGMKGTEVLAKVKSMKSDTLRILMTAYADLSVALDAINKDEVFRLIIKPWDDDALVQTVQEAVNRYQIVQSLKNHDEAKLLSLAQTIELKDPYTHGHCERVANYSLMIADALELSERAIQNLKYGSWLHDVGKIGVPEHILNKKGNLTADEFDIIKKHPVWGADVARQAQLSETTVKIILHHHERYNGTGYPEGIKGADIPLESRIVTVADIYDSLTTDRPYRKRYSEEKVLLFMLSMKESIFDPEIADIFLSKLSASE